MSEWNNISKGVSRFFANNCERPVVWAAFRERTFEEGPAVSGRCNRSTTKNEHLQQNRAKVNFRVQFCYKWAALSECTFEVVEYPKDTRPVSSKVQLVA